MNRKGRLFLCGFLFLSVFINSYTWSESKNIQKKGENLKKGQLGKKIEYNEEFLTRIQRAVRETLKKETSGHLLKPEFTRIDPDFAHRAPNNERVIFDQDIHLDKKNLKTRLEVKLGKTRKVTQITKKISFDKWKVHYNYNGQKKLHSFKGDTEIAGFRTHMMLNSKQKPAFSASRPIKVSETIKVIASGSCDFENKKMGWGLTGSVNKYFTGTVSINRSPGVRQMEYTFKGSLLNFADIRLHGKTTGRTESPHAYRATHNGSLIKKLGKHVSVQAGLQYENSAITNPSFSFVYSRTF